MKPTKQKIDSRPIATRLYLTDRHTFAAMVVVAAEAALRANGQDPSRDEVKAHAATMIAHEPFVTVLSAQAQYAAELEIEQDMATQLSEKLTLMGLPTETFNAKA